MPGMMDTVLNLGLNDVTAAGLAKQAGDERFAYDSYRRFIQMYGNVVLGVEHHSFEEILELHKSDLNLESDTELKAEHWKKVIEDYKAKVEEEIGKPFPQDPKEQLWGAIGAVFGSWNIPRAVTYRKINSIPEDWGTAVNVQAMVFGNMGEDCATGVAFTRNPSTGAKEFYGEYLVNAQGEDVVAGIRTPQQVTIAGKKANNSTLPAMEEVMPTVFKQLDEVRQQLEKHYKDMQDIEFTVQQGKLYMLQTRNGKRTAAAALKIAVDLCSEGLIDEATAVARIDPASLDQLLHPTLDPKAKKEVVARGLPASPGAASGLVVFTADEAEDRATKGHEVILVRVETSPEDIHGMHAAVGILTTRGGMTSHAAVVARGMGRPCVSGAGEIRVDADKKTMVVKGQKVGEGDIITIDGGTGEVMIGKVPTIQPQLSGDFSKLMSWADKTRKLKVRTNAETPLDARTAREFGAEGIGLCRTEHMFFDGTRIVAMREMIMADTVEDRKKALAKILPMQRQDFIELFKIMRGLPVTIRLLDPPLHEFLPNTREEMAEVAAAAGVSVDAVQARAAQLHESNPMLGHRGCRLGITYPEIYEMQARAIFEAAAAVHKEIGETVEAEIMIPLVSVPKELSLMKAAVEKVAAEVEKATGFKAPYLIGTMIELPRAAPAGGRDRQGRAVLLLRHQRPDADHLRPQPRRRRALHRVVRAPGHHQEGPLHQPRPRRRRRAGADRRRPRPQDPRQPEARHLRRAWRRPGLDPLLRQGGTGLRVLLALPRPDRQAGSGASGAQRHGRSQGRGVKHFSLTVTPGLTRGLCDRAARPMDRMGPGSRRLSAAVRDDSNCWG